jgi:CRP-like cAMP-binding protein
MKFPSLGSATPDRRAVSRAFDQGPAILAVPFRQASGGRARSLLSPRERAELAQIAAYITVQKGTRIFREGDPAECIYVIANGYVRTSCALPNGTTHVTSFRSTGDLLGLAAEGRYVETAEAIATISTYQIPLGALEALLRADGSIGLRLLCKLCSMVVTEQCHALILGRNDALGRVAMFLQMLEQAQRTRGWHTATIYLPMSRADIAAYLGLSVEAVSRALSALQQQGIVCLRTKRQMRVTNRPQLEELIGGWRTRRSAAARAKP